MTKVLLLGDSIRMSYQFLVADRLAPVAEVVGPAENCEFSEHTLACLDRWLAELGRPDVVHWNNGLHDCGHNPDRTPVQIPLEAYRTNIASILARLRQTGATVLWATSTPAHPDRPFVDHAWSWRSQEIDRYNAAALEVVTSAGVPVNDLHAVVSADVDTLLSEDRLHLSEAGIDRCAEAVCRIVREQLGCNLEGSAQ